MYMKNIFKVIVQDQANLISTAIEVVRKVFKY